MACPAAHGSKVLVMLQTLLSWAVERDILGINAAPGITLIHKA
ncbi:hypothetical protein [Tsuneonella suprasediminis]|nr:hypothetical protein [Tsuneonella suprasediminis]